MGNRSSTVRASTEGDRPRQQRPTGTYKFVNSEEWTKRKEEREARREARLEKKSGAVDEEDDDGDGFLSKVARLFGCLWCDSEPDSVAAGRGGGARRRRRRRGRGKGAATHDDDDIWSTTEQPTFTIGVDTADEEEGVDMDEALDTREREAREAYAASVNDRELDEHGTMF